MNFRKTWIPVVCATVLSGAVFASVVTAAGPPLKAKTCAACHNDYAKILPKEHIPVDKTAGCMSCHASKPGSDEPTRFSTNAHKIHQGEKTSVECGACHDLQ
ncbi:MAG TPA: cytochrome c3 family protein [Smithellaceae bacterium]|jgi:hypothetical protein|nr:hypothetical protein [Syntrophaceae bacterium]NMC92286.1 hypothetical protein [Smithella sp.]OQC73937.1 MAG: hypothetical protein BWX45_00202 [Deltaproteobacteria bacterium ADurb.Bin002]HNV57201.1 cytochrome c3 family protein [Smithellaceae bacterium]MBP8666672.1 hypothetical protein [Syntrophaceae bacterium]